MSLSPRNNGIINMIDERSIPQVKDGLSKSILISEIISGTGDTSQATYPFDFFYIGSNTLFLSVADPNFLTQSELAAIGTAAQTPAGVLANNGTLWSWYSPAHSLFNTAAPPNWNYPSTGGVCCPGGAHDWRFGIVPTRSFHPGGVNVGMADGAGRFVSNDVEALVWQRLGHISDGAVVAGFE